MSISSIKNYTENSNHTCACASAVHWMGRQLTYIPGLLCEQGAKIFRPLKPGFQDQGSTALIEVCYRVLRILLVALLLLSLPLGIIGGCLRTVANVWRRDFTFIHPAVSTPLQTRINQINIRTFNAAMMPEFICIANGVRPTRQRIKELAEILLQKEDDVVCLQELFETEVNDYLAEQLKEKFPYIICNVEHRTLGIGSGLMIASKYPIEDAQFWKHDDCGGYDELANKGTLAVKIKPTADQTVLIFTTHLNAGADSTDLFPEGHKSYRESQLSQLKIQVEDYIEKTMQESPTIPHVILTGDYNIGPLAPKRDAKGKRTEGAQPDVEWTALKEVMDPLISDEYEGTTCFDLAKDHRAGWDRSKLASWKCVPECIDHIGVPNTSKMIQSVELISRTIDPMHGTSDHLAVAASFKLS